MKTTNKNKVLILSTITILSLFLMLGFYNCKSNFKPKPEGNSDNSSSGSPDSGDNSDGGASNEPPPDGLPDEATPADHRFSGYYCIPSPIQNSAWGESFDIFLEHIVVGAATERRSYPNNQSHISGAAYHYRKTNGSWTQTGKLTIDNRASQLDSQDGFGSHIKISGENTIYGDPYDDLIYNRSGTVVVTDLENGDLDKSLRFVPTAIAKDNNNNSINTLFEAGRNIGIYNTKKSFLSGYDNQNDQNGHFYLGEDPIPETPTASDFILPELIDLHSSWLLLADSWAQKPSGTGKVQIKNANTGANFMMLEPDFIRFGQKVAIQGNLIAVKHMGLSGNRAYITIYRFNETSWELDSGQTLFVANEDPPQHVALPRLTGGIDDGSHQIAISGEKVATAEEYMDGLTVRKRILIYSKQNGNWQVEQQLQYNEIQLDYDLAFSFGKLIMSGRIPPSNNKCVFVFE